MTDIIIHIEKVNLSYLSELHKIAIETFLETYSSQNTKENMDEYVSKNFNTIQISTELNNPESKFYYAKINSQIVGYLKVNFGLAQTEANHPEGVEIERIYVRQQYQGKKVGLALFEKALEIGKARNLDYIWLGVWEKNPKAIRFYEKMGFIAFDKHIFIFGSENQTDIMMKLALNGI